MVIITCSTQGDHESHKKREEGDQESDALVAACVIENTQFTSQVEANEAQTDKGNCRK